VRHHGVSGHWSQCYGHVRPRIGLGRLAEVGVRVFDVPGTHSTVLRPGSEPPMAVKLRDCLDELGADQFT
jgi:hypothetical protein